MGCSPFERRGTMLLQGMNFLKYFDYRPRFVREACIRKISSKSSCRLCKDACQRRAIETIKGGIEIDHACKQCGQCVVVCPTNALLDNGLNFVSEGNKVYVLCGKCQQGQEANSKAVIYCLEKINLKVLLNLSARGITSIVTNMNACSDCKKQHNLMETVDRANRILTIADRETISIDEVEIENFHNSIEKIDKNKADKVIGRRDFLKEIMRESMEIVQDMAPPTVHVKRLQLQELLLIEWCRDQKQKIGVFDIKIQKSKCMECGACMKLCPKEVWEVREAKLIYRPYRCNGCKICEDICVAKAIYVSEEINKCKEEEYEKIEYACSSCEKRFFTYQDEKTICPKCISVKLFNR